MGRMILKRPSRHIHCANWAVRPADEFVDWLRIGLVLALSASMGLQAASTFSATIVSPDNARQVVGLEDTAVKDGVISGKLVNKSRRAIRDVELLVRHSWVWKNEFRPGEDKRSHADYYTVKTIIDPGQEFPFRYELPRALSSSPDGYFETTVSIAGFTEIIPQQSDAAEKR